jgi:hypothetical protein
MDSLNAIVLGLHLASVHVPAHENQNNFNPGIYLRTTQGVQLGVYHNTLSKTTLYVGYATPEWNRMSLMLGAATGYQRETHNVQCDSVARYGETNCKWTTPGVKTYLTPLLAPSVRGPEILTLTPRLTFLPGLAGTSNVFHLSVERSF